MLLSLTKFSEREAPWDLLEARQRLDRPEVSWLLAGDGPLRAQLERAAAEHGFDRVAFPGYLPYPELPRVYAAADVFVHPAREERWGVSVAEALACGLPVVTSDRVGAGYDLVEPGVNGGRYPAGDGAALATELERALRLDAANAAAASASRLSAYGLTATWSGLLATAGSARQRGAL